jgi:hypothetical protein
MGAPAGCCGVAVLLGLPLVLVLVLGLGLRARLCFSRRVGCGGAAEVA